MSDKPNDTNEWNERGRESEPEQEGIDTLEDEALAAHAREEEAVREQEQGNGTANSSKPGGKGWMIASLVLAAALIVVLIRPPFAGGSETVATVNGEKISKEALYDKLITLGGTQTLEGMISELVIEQAVAEANVTTSEEDIDAELATISAQYESQEAFEAELTAYGYTMEQLREQIKNQLAIEKIVSEDVNVTDDEVKQYFEDNKTSFDTPEQVRASHILVATKEEADALLKQIQGGADFAALASENSLDTGTKENGGDLDFFTRGQMEQGFEETAFSLQKGELGIAETSYGFHVVQVTDHQAAKTATLEDNQEDIRKQLEEQQIGELSSAWMTDVQAKAEIDNTLAPEEPEASTEDAVQEEATE